MRYDGVGIGWSERVLKGRVEGTSRRCAERVCYSVLLRGRGIHFTLRGMMVEEGYNVQRYIELRETIGGR